MTTSSRNMDRQIIIVWRKYIKDSLAYSGMLSLEDLITLQTQPEIVRALERYFKFDVTGDINTFLQHYRVKYYTKQGLAYLDTNKSLRGAARFNDRKVIDLAILKGATDFNGALVSAATEGHRDLVTMFLQPVYNVTDFGRAFVNAAGRGYLDLVQMFIKSAIYISNDALYAAARGGHQDIIEFIIAHSVDILELNFDVAMNCAIKGGHKHIVEMLTRPPYNIAISDFKICTAATAGHKNIIQMSIYPPHKITNFNNALMCATYQGHIDLVEMLLNPPYNATDVSVAIEIATKEGHQNIVELISSHIQKQNHKRSDTRHRDYGVIKKSRVN